MRNQIWRVGLVLFAIVAMLVPVSSSWAGDATAAQLTTVSAGAATAAAAAAAPSDPLQSIVRCVMKSQGGNWKYFLLFNGLESLKARSPLFATWWQQSGLKVEDSGAPEKVIRWWKENDPSGVADKDRGMRHLVGAAWAALGDCAGTTVTAAKASTAIAPAGILVETCTQCKLRLGSCWYCYPTPCLKCP